MGILVRTKILVAQCGHAVTSDAFWSSKNNGENAPDLWFQNFPTSGRMLLSNQVLYLACKQCQNSLDDVMKDVIKAGG